jgi:lysophospholipase L1-like esterase
MKMKTRSIIFISLLTLLFSCKPVVDEFTPSRGTADFSRFVSLGNSLTAGFADAALYTSGQEFAFPNIMAQQFRAVNGGEFKTPFIPSELGVRPNLTQQGLYMTTKLVVGYSQDCLGAISLGPVPADSDPDQQELTQALITSVAAEGPFNNVAVPATKITHLFFQGYGIANPYFGRFTTNPAQNLLIDEPGKVEPTFFFFWLGANDVLDYASSGGVEPLTPVAGDVGFGFEASFNAAIAKMVSYADKGLVGNVPAVTATPYFTTIPYNPILLTEQAQVDALNAAYTPYNQLMETNGLPYRITFALGQNPMVIMDADMPLPPPYEQFKFRQIKANEYALLTLPQDSLKCGGWGTQKPVPNQYILTELETATADAAVSAYNNIIQRVVDQYDLALFDAYSIIGQTAEGGITADGITFTSALITGNTFSTDGLHLSPQGHAMVANFCIEAINSHYNANVPLCNVAEFPPLVFP